MNNKKSSIERKKNGRLPSKFQLSGKLTVILMISILASLWFYWFEYRPVRIRRYCYQTTFGKHEEQVESNKSGNKEWKPGKEWISNPMTETRDDEWGWWYPTGADYRFFEIKYAECLLKNGMKAEIPISPLLKK